MTSYTPFDPVSVTVVGGTKYLGQTGTALGKTGNSRIVVQFSNGTTTSFYARDITLPDSHKSNTARARGYAQPKAGAYAAYAAPAAFNPYIAAAAGAAGAAGAPVLAHAPPPPPPPPPATYMAASGNNPWDMAFPQFAPAPVAAPSSNAITAIGTVSNNISSYIDNALSAYTAGGHFDVPTAREAVLEEVCRRRSRGGSGKGRKTTIKPTGTFGCPDGYEISATSGNCIEKCLPGQIRNPNSHRCYDPSKIKRAVGYTPAPHVGPMGPVTRQPPPPPFVTTRISPPKRKSRTPSPMRYNNPFADIDFTVPKPRSRTPSPRRSRQKFPSPLMKGIHARRIRTPSPPRAARVPTPEDYNWDNVYNDWGAAPVPARSSGRSSGSRHSGGSGGVYSGSSQAFDDDEVEDV